MIVKNEQMTAIRQAYNFGSPIVGPPQKQATMVSFALPLHHSFTTFTALRVGSWYDVTILLYVYTIGSIVFLF
jgi:hypothetical protein